MQYSPHLLRHTRFIIGQNIQKYRSQLCLSVAELSIRSGVSETIITNYENAKGDVHLPPLMRIAGSLKVRVRELMP